MVQKEYKYVGFSDNHLEEITVRANSIDGLMDKIESWYSRFYFDDYEAQQIDNTICITDFQFLIYKITNNVGVG